MPRILLALLLPAILFSCEIRNANHNADVLAKENPAVLKDTTTVQVIDSVYDFGKVTDGEKVEYNFRFRNTGKNPLIISNAVASCGCTVPQKPDAPIAQGQIGFLKVVFDSRGRVGAAHKDITVTSNAHPSFPVLKLVGEVVARNN